MGGYEANFNPPLDEKYKCPVCLSALRDPVQTRCGHRLCTICFKQIRGGNWYFRCPVDNTWSNNVFEDTAFKREVLSLKVNCVNLSKSCDWHGELRELDEHTKACQYESVECPNKCNSDVPRIDLQKHLLQCPLRREKCEHCNVDIIANQLAHHHVLICPKFPINCPMCGEVQISRDTINSHINIINGDCPQVLIPCSFQHIGCMHQDKRSQMAKHYAEANTQHLMLLSTRLVDLEMKHRLDLDICAQRFETIITELQKRLEHVETRNQDLESKLTKLTNKKY